MENADQYFLNLKSLITIESLIKKKILIAIIRAQYYSIILKFFFGLATELVAFQNGWLKEIGMLSIKPTDAYSLF